MGTNRTFKKDFAKKKTYSVFSAELDTAMFDGTNSIDVGLLPEKSLVSNIYVITEEAGQAGLTLDVLLDTTVVINDTAVSTAGAIAELGTNSLTGTGKVVSVTPSVAPTAGKFIVVIEYVEYTLTSGTLTRYKDN